MAILDILNGLKAVKSFIFLSWLIERHSTCVGEAARNIVATRMYEGARQTAKLIQWRAKRFNAQLLWLNEADGLGTVRRIADIKVQTGTSLLVKGTEKRTNKRTSLWHTYIVSVKQCVFVAIALIRLRIQNI